MGGDSRSNREQRSQRSQVTPQQCRPSATGFARLQRAHPVRRATLKILFHLRSVVSLNQQHVMKSRQACQRQIRKSRSQQRQSCVRSEERRVGKECTTK